MSIPWEMAAITQHIATAAASGFNTFHFLGYKASRRRRRWGAFTLALVNMAFLAQSIYLGLLPLAVDLGVEDLLSSARFRFFLSLLPLAASVLILLLVISGRKTQPGRA